MRAPDEWTARLDERHTTGRGVREEAAENHGNQGTRTCSFSREASHHRFRLETSIITASMSRATEKAAVRRSAFSSSGPAAARVLADGDSAEGIRAPVNATPAPPRQIPSSLESSKSAAYRRTISGRPLRAADLGAALEQELGKVSVAHPLELEPRRQLPTRSASRLLARPRTRRTSTCWAFRTVRLTHR
jgi:hypothetical protein